MKKLIFLFSFVFLLSVIGRAESVSTGLTLKECYSLALKRSEAVAIQKELINETEGQMLQALSTALPKVAFAYSNKWQDTDKGASFEHGSQEGKFTLTQPLFTGFKEFAAVGASKHVGKQREAELARAKELLFTDVSDAFYLYLSYQEDGAAVGEIVTALTERIDELKKREAIGRSRVSEVASAEARLSRAQATLEGVRGQQEVAAQLLEFLIGQPVDRLVDDVTLTDVGDLSQLAGRADERADVRAIREAAESFKNNVVSARSGFLPAVSVTGNSYVKRPNTYEGNDWDVTLNVNVPLFNGTTDIGLLRQARSQKAGADLKLSQARRRALMEIKSAYAKYQAADRRLKALGLAVEATDRNYGLQKEDFKNSLVNNLDVLQALEDLQNVRREFVAVKADQRRAYYSLKVATGDVTP